MILKKISRAHLVSYHLAYNQEKSKGKGYGKMQFNQSRPRTGRHVDTANKYKRGQSLSARPTSGIPPPINPDKSDPDKPRSACYNIAENRIMPWNISHDALYRMKNLIKSYDKLPMDLADASLVLLAEHLGQGNILLTDRPGYNTYRFNTYRWKNHKPFNNLLSPYD